METTSIAFLLSQNDLTRLNTAREKKNDEDAVQQTLTFVRNSNNCDLVCLPLTNDTWKERWQRMCLINDSGSVSRDPSLEETAELWRAGNAPLELREMTVRKIEEITHAIGLASNWIYLDSADEWIRHDSELALLQEIDWAAYLNLTTLILPAPRHRERISSYARAVNAALNRVGNSQLQLSVCMPVYHSSATLPSPPASSELLPLSWEMWDIIRSMCDYNSRLSLTLDLSFLPAILDLPELLGRWSAEPVRNVMLSAGCFVSNPKGYPVLSKDMQAFIRKIVKFHPTFILSNINDRIHAAGGAPAYAQYLRHLEKTSPEVIAQNTQGTLANFTLGWGDYLQAPLQPLQDNLGSHTYDIFERCPVKYKHYEEAIYEAIKDRPSIPVVNVYVVGAGRGPLVECSLGAFSRSNREGHVYVIEKNAGAYITLQDLHHRRWGDKVTLLFGDMRALPTPAEETKAHILVSELLGSFGDNELSPECLDGAMRFLRPNGISIPSTYTAFLAPLTSSKLFTEVRSHDQSLKDAETPYVVALHAFDILSGDGGGRQGTCGSKVQECWEFEHPRKDQVNESQALTNSHNIRSATLTFHIPKEGTLHGFAGYFEAILYGTIGLSTHPERMDRISRDMTSWFPLLFPIKDPLFLPADSELHVSVWRLTDKSRVWYEWFAECFLPVLASHPTTLLVPPASSRVTPLLYTPTALASPMVDASSPVSMNFPMHSSNSSLLGNENNSLFNLVKTGHTALHNPNGRSSFIGL